MYTFCMNISFLFSWADPGMGLPDHRVTLCSAFEGTARLFCSGTFSRRTLTAYIQCLYQLAKRVMHRSRERRTANWCREPMALSYKASATASPHLPDSVLEKSHRGVSVAMRSPLPLSWSHLCRLCSLLSDCFPPYARPASCTC